MAGCLFLALVALQACTNTSPTGSKDFLLTSTGPTYTPTPCSGVLGTNTIGPTPVAGSTFVWFNPYVPAVNKDIVNLSMYSSSAGSVTWEMGVYNSNASGTVPATLLGQTVPQTIGPSTGWNTASLSPAVNLTGGVTYWLALHSTSSNYAAGGVTYAYQTVPATYGFLPAVYAGPAPVAPYTFSMYGTTCP